MTTRLDLHADELADAVSEYSGEVERKTVRRMVAEIRRRRADQNASAERIRTVVRREVIDRTACVAGWEGFSPGSIDRMADDIASRVAAQLTLEAGYTIGKR